MVESGKWETKRLILHTMGLQLIALDDDSDDAPG
jgi:hypothetical protein